MKVIVSVLSLCFCIAYGASRYELNPSAGVSPNSSNPVAPAVVPPKEKPMNINVRGVELQFLLNLLSQEAGVPVVFREIPQEVLQGKITYFSMGKPFRIVMDEITSMKDLWWEEKDGVVEVYRYKSVSFPIGLPLLEKNIEQSEGGLRVAYRRNLWNKLEEGIKALVKDPGSKVNVADTGSGFVVLYARPSEVRAVKEFVERLGDVYSRTIPLVVTTYLINDDLFRQIGAGINFKAGDVSGSLANPIPNPIFNISVISSKVEFNLKALAQQGKVSTIEKVYQTALNGQPIYYAPIRKTRIISEYNVSFVSPVGGGQPQQGSGVVPTVQVRTEDIPAGTTLVIVPYYLDRDRIVVDLYRKQDRIEKIDRIAVNLPGVEGQNFINLPQLATTTNLNQTVMSRGETLMLFTGAMTTEELRDAGIPFLKDIPLIGYLFSTKEKKEELYRLVITIKFGGEDEDR